MFNKKFFSLSLACAVLATGLSVAANAAEVFVRIGPPRARVERVVPRPGAGYVWVGGYYRWNGAAYLWTPGRWMYPPRPGAVWVAPHWDFVAGRRGYVLTGGFWR